MTTDFKGKAYNVFQMFNDQWAVITAGTLEKYNAMTISWGSMGTLWGMPGKGKSTMTVYVNPERYTHQFVEENEYFNVCFFPPEYRKDLGILGSKSGRDCDKVDLTELTPTAASHGVAFEQAKLTLSAGSFILISLRLRKFLRKCTKCFTLGSSLTICILERSLM